MLRGWRNKLGVRVVVHHPRKVPWGFLTGIGIGLTIAAVVFSLRHSPSESAGVGLRVEMEQGIHQIRWRADSPVVQKADGGTMFVRDGDRAREFRLSWK